MAGAGKKWLLGCGLGCGIPVLVVIVVTVVGGMRLMKPFDEAVAVQKDLTAAFGPREEYVPPVDGLTPERLEAFLAVRRELAPLCADMAAVGAKFRRVEELEEQEGDPGKGEMLKAIGGATGAAFGLAGNIGRFTGTRNRALLDQGMGLGEYAWIYILAYNSDLGEAPNSDFDDREGRPYSGGERRLILALMENHAVALDEAGRAGEAGLWREEAARIERSGDAGVPFADGTLPAEIADRLAPYRDRLAELHCTETSAFEFNRVRRKGLSIQAE